VDKTKERIEQGENMRRFSSYGPINEKTNYYAPREELINFALHQILGEPDDEGGHFITVWAPRQTGKTWVMKTVRNKIRQTGDFDVALMSMEAVKNKTKESEIAKEFVRELSLVFNMEFPAIEKIAEIRDLFTTKYFTNRVILLIDEFDSLQEEFISEFANTLRYIYLSRNSEDSKKSKDKTLLLHGVALIGVRSVLGIENVRGSPFNIQRSIHIPNLTNDEVQYIYDWYQKESGQKIEQCVIDDIYYEFKGQPGLTCWFGEMLIEKYNDDPQKPIDLKRYQYIYKKSTNIEPNANIINIINKSKVEPYKSVILELFKTSEKVEFTFDDVYHNYLYMNGIIDIEETEGTQYVRFSSSFIQKRLFNYFAREIYSYTGVLVSPEEDLSGIIENNKLIISEIIKLYKKYLVRNKHWLFKDVPRRVDGRIFEAVYHFNLYRFLCSFLERKEVTVHPEFPTGNGKIDLLLEYEKSKYGLELKSFVDIFSYKEALVQSAKYAEKLGLNEIYLLLFIEKVSFEFKQKIEVEYIDNETRVNVIPLLIEI